MKIITVVFCLMLNAGCSDNDDLTEEPPGPVHNENISIGSGNPELILADGSKFKRLFIAFFYKLISAQFSIDNVLLTK